MAHEQHASHEKEGPQSQNTHTFSLPEGIRFGVTTLINTGREITVNLYAQGEDNSNVLIYTAQDSGTNNKTLSGTATAGETGEVTVEILQNNVPIVATKSVYPTFAPPPGIAIVAAEDAGNDDYNDAIVILNWPLG